MGGWGGEPRPDYQSPDEMLMPLAPVMPVRGGSMEVFGWKSPEEFEMLPSVSGGD